MTTRQIIANFLELQSIYAFTRRKLITADRYVTIAQKGLVSPRDYENQVLHESLMEHVGHLPILATFMYSHLENKDKVDLGRVLIMLAIHDIGETITGEIFAYTKTDKEEQEEYEAALSRLHPDLIPYMKEFEAAESWDAKFAKSMDSMAPNIHEMYMPKVTMARSAALGTGVDDIIKKKRKYMEWDPFLLETFDLLMEQYRAAIEGREGSFKVEGYDVV
ncbi:MAG: hypothetical protein RJB39_706 [Candidatus Parcubacteria bacterium]|jgi:hypothetical protein